MLTILVLLVIHKVVTTDIFFYKCTKFASIVLVRLLLLASFIYKLTLGKLLKKFSKIFLSPEIFKILFKFKKNF